MNLAKEISTLLYAHDCVIIPDFGAFLLRDRHSEYNEQAKYALPRQRTVSFNKQITNNDGLLANHIAHQNNCTYEEGLNKIKEYNTILWQELRSARNIDLAEIGTLYYTQEDKLVFVPHPSANFSTKSYGLPKLRLQKIESAEYKNTPPILAVNNSKSKKPVVPEPKTSATLLETDGDTAKAKLKAKKRQEKKSVTDNTPRRRRPSKLAIVNTLGMGFLIWMIFAIVYVETQQAQQNKSNMEIASLLDTPQATTTLISQLPSYGIYARVNSPKEGKLLLGKLSDKYPNARHDKNADNSSYIFILSFDEKELAQEYSQLLQNKMNRKLVIKQK